MRRTLLLLFAILLICWAISSTRSRPALAPPPTATLLPPSHTPLAAVALPTVSFTAVPTPTVTPSRTLTLTPSASPTAEATVTFTATPVPGPVQATVLLHPDGGLYAGDQVSFEVIVFPQDEARGTTSQVLVSGPDGSRLGSAGFGLYGLGQRQEALLLWAWIRAV